MASPTMATQEISANQASAIAIVAGSLGIGLAAALFIPPDTWGFGFPIFIIIGWVIAKYTARRATVEQNKQLRFLEFATLIFSVLVAWRDSGELRFLNLAMAGLLVGIMAIRSRPAPIQIGSVYDYPFRAIGAWFCAFIDTFSLLINDISWGMIPAGRRGSSSMAAIRGLIITAPILILFGALFANADANFERLIQNLFQFDGAALAQQLIIGSAMGWFAAGFFRRMFLDANPLIPAAAAPPVLQRTHLAGIELGIVLVSLNLLFLLFVSTQWRYFFGGSDFVRGASGLGVAEFARRGFFELVAVTGLTLPLLLGLHYLTDFSKPTLGRMFKSLASCLLVLLIVVMASAALKLQLYMTTFGMSTLRLYVAATLVWLAVVFVWFVLTMMKDRPNRFAWGAVVSLAATVFGLNLLNPDQFVAEWNLRPAAAKAVDWSYLAELSADATPVILQNWERVPTNNRHLFANKLMGIQGRTPNWRSRNISELQAIRLIQPKIGEFRASVETP